MPVTVKLREPDRGPQGWVEQHEARDAVYANRRRIRARVGSGYCGGTANCWNVRTRISTKRVACAGRICGGTTTFSSGWWCTRRRSHLGLWMRTMTGIGTPQSLQGRAVACTTPLIGAWGLLAGPEWQSWSSCPDRDRLGSGRVTDGFHLAAA